MLPHPSVGSCVDCHQVSSGGRLALGYDHASTLISVRCNACHEAGSDLVFPPWNGATDPCPSASSATCVSATNAGTGAGGTRPFTLPNVKSKHAGNTCPGTANCVVVPNHFYPVDCKECHNAPVGSVTASSGTVYATRWNFPHTESKMTNPSSCKMCHNPVPN